MKTLDARLDVTLRPDIPHAIPALDLTVTLLRAERLRLRDGQKGITHADSASIRFERPGEPPVTFEFGAGERVHVFDRHSFAVFGGTELTIFPPGVPVIP